MFTTEHEDTRNFHTVWQWDADGRSSYESMKIGPFSSQYWKILKLSMREYSEMEGHRQQETRTAPLIFCCSVDRLVENVMKSEQVWHALCTKCSAVKELCETFAILLVTISAHLAGERLQPLKNIKKRSKPACNEGNLGWTWILPIGGDVEDKCGQLHEDRSSFSIVG